MLKLVEIDWGWYFRIYLRKDQALIPNYGITKFLETKSNQSNKPMRYSQIQPSNGEDHIRIYLRGYELGVVYSIV